MAKRNHTAWTPAQVAAHCARVGQANPLEAGGPAKKPVPRRGRMNKTESEFARILEAMKVRGEIKDFVFEGIRLAWGMDPETGKQMHYTGDFAITENDGSIRLAEIKGSHIFSRDVVRFKGCRAQWPQFRFELHQKSREGWKRIH